MNKEYEQFYWSTDFNQVYDPLLYGFNSSDEGNVLTKENSYFWAVANSTTQDGFYLKLINTEPEKQRFFVFTIITR